MGDESGHVVFAESPSGGLPSNHVKRDELISRMLQDRNTLRLIVAPRGFGKTTLMNEYAARLFSGGVVRRVDASTPDFLLALDSKDRKALFDEKAPPDLVMIDNLPWLHEQRAGTLSNLVDAALFLGVEVLVAATPSCDCLSALQSDRLCLRAVDLLVSEGECVPGQASEIDGDARAFGRRRWREAGAMLFGHTPAIMWDGGQTQRDSLTTLLGENLPVSLVQGMFAMLLLGTGNVRDLEGICVTLRGEDVSILAHDYPVFGIDVVSGDFNTGQFDLADLKHAVLANRHESVVLEGSFPLSERILGFLFQKGELRRGTDVIDVFCNDEQCASWLIERGWDFLDAGEVSLVSSLLERCPDESYAREGMLQALHAWLSGLSGDRREACHIARRVLSDADRVDRPDAACIAARIALAQFDENAILSTESHVLSADEGVTSELDFIAAMLDSCTNVEIARAFNIDGDADDIRYEKARRAPGKNRTRRLVGMFTEHAENLGDSRAFRVALHLLAHVDNPDLRQLVQTLGCDAVLRMRRTGVTTFCDALLVRDLWQTGYFGLVGPVVDRRDAKVLDGASHMLEILATSCGRESAYIPWELHGISSAREGYRAKPNLPKAGAEEMYVRLFGGFEVTVGDRFLGEGKWRKKARSLFALLALNHGRDVPRDDLLAQLWPGLSRTNALDNFYTVWGNCVSVVGEAPYLERNGEYCRVDPRFVRSDVSEFEQLTRHLLTSDRDSNYLLDTYAKIEVLYRGSLMPSERNVRTIVAQRDRYRALYVDAMVAASECAMRVADTRIALWFARKAMEEDQTREDVYRTLMKAQIAAGQRCPAIKTYLVCRDYLQSTLGLDPSLETRELYNALVTTDPELLRLEASLESKSLLHVERRR